MFDLERGNNPGDRGRDFQQIVSFLQSEQFQLQPLQLDLRFRQIAFDAIGPFTQLTPQTDDITFVVVQKCQ